MLGNGCGTSGRPRGGLCPGLNQRAGPGTPLPWAIWSWGAAPRLYTAESKPGGSAIDSKLRRMPVHVVSYSTGFATEKMIT